MACPCNNPTIITPNPTCKDCLVAKTVRYGCDNSPDPCGESVTIDLSEINKITTCGDCGATYTIKKYDVSGFDSVTISNNGVLTYVTSDTFEKQKEYEITYKISCNCGTPQLSTTAKIYVCKKDMCKNAPNGADCSHCSGEYILAKDHTIYKSASPLSKCSGTGTFDLSTITEENSAESVTYSIVSNTQGLTAVSILGSVVSFSKLGTSYSTQEIVWEAIVNGLVSQGKLSIEIKNLCATVKCANGFICDECNGTCRPVLNDLQIINEIQ